MIQPRNHSEWGPHQFKVLVWAVKVVRGSAFFNLLFASRASIIVLPALCWAARGRLEGESTQNMTLSLFTSCSLLPSIEGAGEEGEMQSCAAACRLTLKNDNDRKPVMAYLFCASHFLFFYVTLGRWSYCTHKTAPSGNNNYRSYVS